jgi:type IV secretion system protein VirB6
MDGWNVFVTLWGAFGQTAIDASRAISAQMSGILGMALTAACILYLTLKMATFLLFPTGEPFGVLLQAGVRVVIVLTTISGLLYSNTIIPLIFDSIDGLSQAIAGASGTAVAGPAAFDTLLNKSWVTAVLIYKSIPSLLDSPGVAIFLYVLVVAYMVAATLAICVSFFIYIKSFVAIAMLAILGPVAIFLSLFDQTRRFFHSWVGTIVSSTFVILLSTGLLAIMLAQTNPLITQIITVSKPGGGSANDPLGMLHLALQIAAAFALQALMAREIAGIAGSIGHAAAAQTAGITNSVYSAVAAAPSAARSVGNWAEASGSQVAAGIRSLQPTPMRSAP